MKNFYDLKKLPKCCLGNRFFSLLLINELRRDGILGGHRRTLTVHLDAVRAILEVEGLEILE